MAHRFNDRFHARLTNPRRRRLQPVGPALRLLGLSRAHVFLDLGCGPGYFLLPAAARVKTAWGLDVSPVMIRAARKNAADAGRDNVRLRRVGERRLPLAANSADRALMTNVLHELVSPEGTLAEIFRILAPGGRLLLVDWRPGGSRRGPPKSECIPSRRARKMLKDAGFEGVTSHGIYREQWALLARAPGGGAGD